MHRSASLADPHQIRVETYAGEDEVVVVRLQSQADVPTAPLLRDAIDEAVSKHTSVIVIDLSHLEFVDSTTLGVLLRASRRARQQGTEMRIVVADPSVRRIFELTLLDRALALYPTMQLAVAR